MHKKPLTSGNFLIVNEFVSKKENQLQNSRPITSNLQSTFNSNIYVKFIPADVTEDQVREKFSGFPVQILKGVDAEGKKIYEQSTANIISLKVNSAQQFSTEPDAPKPSQYAYIMYDSVQAAQRAIQSLDGTYIFGGTRPLSVEMWVSKDEKEKEKKLRDDRQAKQLVTALLFGNRDGSQPGMFPHPQRPYTQGGAQGGQN